MNLSYAWRLVLIDKEGNTLFFFLMNGCENLFFLKNLTSEKYFVTKKKKCISHIGGKKDEKNYYIPNIFYFF